MAKLNLRSQIQDILPRVNGGTDNEYGAASKWLLVYRVNDGGDVLDVGTLVTIDDHVRKTTTVNQKVAGVVVGYVQSDGTLAEAAAAVDSLTAIAIAGIVTVLTTSSATRGYYVCASNTDGQADVSTTVQGGSFGHVIQAISSSNAVVLMGPSSVPVSGVSGFATPAVVLSSSAAAGSAGTVIRSDSTIAAFDATSPTTQAIGDAAAVGTAAFAARRDHKHAMPAFGTGPAAVGTQANGSSANIARIDHVHATGAGTPTTAIFGDTAATGSGPAAAMTDHRHGMPNGVGAILIIDTPAGSPLVFADLVQNDDGDDLMYGEG